MPANTQSMIIHAGTRAISYCCSGLPTCSLASAMIFAGGCLYGFVNPSTPQIEPC